MKYIALCAILSLLLLTGCADMNKAQTGALGGAAGGALVGQIIGHNTEATLIGAAVGTMLGYIVGNEMDKYDRQELNHVYERGVSNQTSSWVNPDTGNQYRVTPMPAYRDPSTNRICRKAEIDALIDGKMEKTVTTACRNENGQWQLQS
ncbi:RT0821/Lpp0805 family surface protein [Thermodesulfobacteriota bacterium B35]